MNPEQVSRVTMALVVSFVHFTLETEGTDKEASTENGILKKIQVEIK